MTKYLNVLLFFLLCINAGTSAQPYKTADSPVLIIQQKQLQKLSTQVDTLKQNIDSIKIKLMPNSVNIDKGNCWGIFIALLPGILFLIMLLIFYLSLKNKFSLSDALTDDDFITRKIQNEQYKIENITAIAKETLLAPQVTTILPPTIEISGTEKSKSSSRYLAVMTCFTTLIIVVCMVSFYMYSYIKNPLKTIDFGGLSTALLSLIVGIAPYSFNKLSEGIKGK